MAVFNPKILEVSKDTELFKEGCLSYPDLWLTIKRPTAIIAEYQNSQGEVITAEMDGLIARCFQHEFDHLKGICFVDRVSQMKLQLAMKKLNKRK
jgi:peptide deformylase